MPYMHSEIILTKYPTVNKASNKITCFFVDSHEIQEFDPHKETCKRMEGHQNWSVNVTVIMSCF